MAESVVLTVLRDEDTGACRVRANHQIDLLGGLLIVSEGVAGMPELGPEVVDAAARLARVLTRKHRRMSVTVITGDGDGGGKGSA